MAQTLPSQLAASSLGSASQAQLASRPPMQHDWSQQRRAQHPWTYPPGTAGDVVFDFGFHESDSCMLTHNTQLPSPAGSTSHGVVSPQPWESDVPTLRMPSTSQSHFQQPLLPPGMQMAAYVGTRRGLIADALTNNFESIAVASGAPQTSFQSAEEVSSDASEGRIDLASRRKRPRPTALLSPSLRSRSYGALTAASSAFRQGVTSPSGHSLRHVKSTGHNLNGHYPGIRKSSIPQRSPLNFTTFAESEALQELMAQKAAEDTAQQHF